MNNIMDRELIEIANEIANLIQEFHSEQKNIEINDIFDILRYKLEYLYMYDALNNPDQEGNYEYYV